MEDFLLTNLLDINTVRIIIPQLKGRGLSGLSQFLVKSLHLLTEENLQAWKTILEYVGSSEDLRREINNYLFTFPSISITVILALFRETNPNKLEELFFESARRNVADYIVILLEYLRELGVTYTWGKLFRDLDIKDEHDSIKNIMLATAHSYEIFLAEFDEMLNGNKVFIDLIFEAFNLKNLPHEELRVLANTAASSDIRKEASREHNESFSLDLEDEEIPDPFDVKFNEAVHMSYFNCTLDEAKRLFSTCSLEERRKSQYREVDDEELDMEADIDVKYGPLNSMIKGGCKKYGGCRMYSCACVEESWYKNKCIACKEDIPTIYEAIRIPIESGGWRGCYCSHECFTGTSKKKDQKRWIKILSSNE